MILKQVIRKISIYLGAHIHSLSDQIARSTLPKFGNTPKNIVISLPRRITNSENIFLGENVFLGPNTFLNPMTHYPTAWMKHPEIKQDLQQFNAKIIIGNNVSATGGLQISAQSTITIEDDVLFSSNVHINDALHGFEHANQPYKYQPLFRIAPIVIGRGCWIGQNVVILPGVTIGKHSIIGANSVVTKSVPAQCIAAGNPARVIKQWDQSSMQWISVKNTVRRNSHNEECE